MPCSYSRRRVLFLYRAVIAAGGPYSFTVSYSRGRALFLYRQLQPRAGLESLPRGIRGRDF